MRTRGEELAKLALLAIAFIAYGLEGDRDKPVDYFFVAGLVIWVYIGLRLGLRPRAGDGGDTVPPRHEISGMWRDVLVGLLGVTLLLFPFSLRYSYSCPHGKRWTNNQIGIAWSANGGPCGNGPRPRMREQTWRVVRNWYVFVPSRW